jgi:hypothetical protein
MRTVRELPSEPVPSVRFSPLAGTGKSHIFTVANLTVPT